MTLSAGAALVVCVASWALWPIRTPGVQVVAPVHPGAVESVLPRQAMIDPRVFAVNLWNPPAAPDAETIANEAKPEPPRPINVQLIGIIHEGGIRRAAIYDIEADRLLIVSNGDHIRGNIIKSISEKAVELSDGHTSRLLTLIQSTAAAPGGPS